MRLVVVVALLLLVSSPVLAQPFPPQEEIITLRLTPSQLEYIAKLMEQRPIGEAVILYNNIQQQIHDSVAQTERSKRAVIENSVRENLKKENPQ